MNTEVELSEGQSFALAGLLDNRETETLSKVPFIGDIPILGKLFSSKLKTKNNSELMVIVTPQLVRPIPAGQPLPSLNYPQSFLPPNTDKVMASPGQNVTGPVPVQPPTQTVPVETLLKSFQQRPLVINSTSPGVIGAGGTALGGGQAMAPAQTPAPTVPPPPQ